MILTPHFSWSEVTFSEYATRNGIDNSITQKSQVERNAIKAAMDMEVVRDLLRNRPINVTSWFRCAMLNGAIGGSRNSAHIDGYAVDFTCREFGTPLQIVTAISASDIKFDQCIQEGNWVHISFAPTLRGEILTAHFDSTGKATYSKGLV